MDTKPQSVVKTCRVCKTEKQIEQFLKGRNICSCCNNEQRRNKYSNDEELRKKLIGNADIALRLNQKTGFVTIEKNAEIVSVMTQKRNLNVMLEPEYIIVYFTEKNEVI